MEKSPKIIGREWDDLDESERTAVMIVSKNMKDRKLFEELL